MKPIKVYGYCHKESVKESLELLDHPFLILKILIILFPPATPMRHIGTIFLIAEICGLPPNPLNKLRRSRMLLGIIQVTPMCLFLLLFMVRIFPRYAFLVSFSTYFFYE